MARAEAQYLRLFSGGATFARYQNYYVGTQVTWSSVTWDWLSFDADGFTDGQTGDEGGLSITLPATAPVMADIQLALRDAWLAEVTIYEFDTLRGDTTPQAAQVLIGSMVGEVVGADGDFPSLSLTIGSSLAPVGAQVPPRTFTTRLIGAPCKL